MVSSLIELTEIMRQKHDLSFTQLLNRIRTGSQTEDDITTINARIISPFDPNYPSDALHIWAENQPVTEHNRNKLDEIDSPLYILYGSAEGTSDFRLRRYLSLKSEV